MKKMLQHMAMLGIVCFLSFLFIYGAHRHSIQPFNFCNALCYLGSYVLFPICVIFLGRKYRIFRWYCVCAMGLVILVTSMMYYRNMETVEQDLSDYLDGDSEFMQIAAGILPAKSEIELSEDVSYCHRKSNSGFEIIELDARYDPEAYLRMVSNAENNMAYLQDAATDPVEIVFMDGHVYTCVMIHTQSGYYAAAYSTCSDCQSVSWLFIQDEDLSYMSIADVLAYYEQ